MHVHRIAYRLPNGDVEGFKGVGSTPVAAAVAAVGQVRRKLAILGADERLEDSRTYHSREGLTDVEYANVQNDWACNLGY